ncbi:MAG: response regulator transcription factor [Oscillospiraceae bacterium]|nr:response regulator transcription factor [Oscillospiraceae bacterium]
MYRIFLVEDDSVIAGEMKRVIDSWGFETKCAEDFRSVLEEFSAFDPHLVLLDLALPFYNGYHWCTEIRRTSSVPILFISSAADNMSMVMAMNMGADDFIAKPVDMNVLVAKIKAVLRRCYDYVEQVPTYTCRGAVFHPADATMEYQGQRLSLTKNDCRILQTLLEHKGSLVSRDTLMMRLWETDSFIDENTLTVNIARLRRKLDGLGLTDLIVTKKGMGYMIGE